MSPKDSRSPENPAAENRLPDLVVLYFHVALIFIANWTTTMNRNFAVVFLAPFAIVVATNVFNIWKNRRWSNAVGFAAGLIVVAIQCSYAYFAYPHSGEGALGAAIIIACGPWVYAGVNVISSAFLSFKKR